MVCSFPPACFKLRCPLLALYSLDGMHFAVGRPSGSIEVWNVHHNEIVKTLSMPSHS